MNRKHAPLVSQSHSQLLFPIFKFSQGRGPTSCKSFSHHGFSSFWAFAPLLDPPPPEARFPIWPSQSKLALESLSLQTSTDPNRMNNAGVAILFNYQVHSCLQYLAMIVLRSSISQQLTRKTVCLSQSNSHTFERDASIVNSHMFGRTVTVSVSFFNIPGVVQPHCTRISAVTASVNLTN